LTQAIGQPEPPQLFEPPYGGWLPKKPQCETLGRRTCSFPSGLQQPLGLNTMPSADFRSAPSHLRLPGPAFRASPTHGYANRISPDKEFSR